MSRWSRLLSGSAAGDGDEGPGLWLAHQLLDTCARSARGTAVIAVHLCARLGTAAIVAEQYETILLRLLTFTAPELAGGAEAKVRSRSARVGGGSMERSSIGAASGDTFDAAHPRAERRNRKPRCPVAGRPPTPVGNCVQAHIGGVTVDGAALDPVVRDALTSVAIAPRVAAATCLHHLGQVNLDFVLTRYRYGEEPVTSHLVPDFARM